MTPRKHRHADLMRRWLDDDSLVVERRGRNDDDWSTVYGDPSWFEDCEYRFKPKMIKCGDMEFPEPMRVAPKAGTGYWVAQICVLENIIVLFDKWVWSNDEQDRACLKAGICHTTREAAELHARALIALTEVKE